ncbi:MAG: hypothetical protein AAGA80_05775 [Cyanobacteria bacterium P01_F01_bin.143]
MKTNANFKFKLPFWWFILPAYLTLWTFCFSIYNYLDGNGMMEKFGIDTGGASDFIMLNSAGRYLAILVAMIVGIWVFRTFSSIMTALLVRLSMDIMDLVAGLQSGVIVDTTGVIQSFIMFLLPNLISIWLLLKFRKRNA